MSDPTIPDLRHRAWAQAINAVDALNSLNAIIFEGETITPIHRPEENVDNFFVDYIQEGIDKYNQYTSEIQQKTTYLNMLKAKNDECINAVNALGG